MKVLPQNYRIPTLYPRRHSLPNKWKRLVTIKSPQLDDFSVERKSVVRECRLAKPNPAHIFIDCTAGLKQPNVNCIQRGIFQIPKLDALNCVQGHCMAKRVIDGLSAAVDRCTGNRVSRCIGI